MQLTVENFSGGYGLTIVVRDVSFTLPQGGALAVVGRNGTTMLMVEQNLDLSLAVADRIAVLKLGQIALECAAEESARERLTRELAL
jgi:ABC-type branched-subunit amino acid transport system ATPase component